jgi:DHA1 family bicyclomycin/chloramphenicol resistance-like MFS transporter
VIPNAPAVALSRHSEAAGTAAALLGAAQFGLGALVAPLVGALGNGALALATVMTAGMAIALVALLLVGGGNDDDPDADEVIAEAVAEPA